MSDSTTSPEGLNPSGLCMCGCGEKTTIAVSTWAPRGDVKGQPKRYMAGHAGRKSPVEYLVDDATGCWIWQRAVKQDGYGSTRVNRVNTLAHKAYYERAYGPVPTGLELDHLCRNRACVNPAHLEAVTHTENVRRGSRARLTIEDARAIRAFRAAGESSHDVAARYGVSYRTVNMIVRDELWVEDGCVRVLPAGPRVPKVSCDDAAVIVARYASGGVTQRQIAAEYGINQSTVSDIVSAAAEVAS